MSQQAVVQQQAVVLSTVGKTITVDNTTSTTDDRHTHGLGMQIDAALTVTFVGEGGQAIAQGVEVGDVITKMGGELFFFGKTDADAVAALTAAKAESRDLVVEFNGGPPAPPPAPAPKQAPAAVVMESVGDDLTKFKMTLIRGYEVQVNAGMACCGATMKVLFMKPNDNTTLYIAPKKSSTNSVDAYKFANVTSVCVTEHKSNKIVQINTKDGNTGFFLAPNPSTATKFAKYLGQLTA
jgi:hypothetical protein